MKVKQERKQKGGETRGLESAKVSRFSGLPAFERQGVVQRTQVYLFSI
jgi:hypothetical protein